MEERDPNDGEVKKTLEINSYRNKLLKTFTDMSLNAKDAAINTEIAQSLIEKGKNLGASYKEKLKEIEEREEYNLSIHQEAMINSYECYLSKLHSIVEKIKENEKFIDLRISNNSDKNKLVEIMSELEDYRKSYKKSVQKFNEETNLFLEVKKQYENDARYISARKEEISEISQEINCRYEDIKNRLLKLEKNSKGIDDKYSNFSHVIGNIKAIEKEAKSELEKQKKSLESSFVKMKQTFKAKVQTEAAVTFWEKKAKEHQKKEKSLKISLILFTLLSLSALALIVVVFKYLNVRMGDMQLWPVVTIGALSLFIVWITRLLVNLYITQINLKEDAFERVTKVKMFVSMLKDDAMSKDDMSVVLQSLFRSTQVAGSEEPVPTLPVELLVKMFGKQK